MDGGEVRSLLDKVDRFGMTLARVPKPTDFKSGVKDALEFKPIAVEDLLGRPQTPLDRSAMRSFISGRRVLVTGAGGTIGSELVRQVSDFGPSRVLLFDNSEFNLYSIDLELAERHPSLWRKAVIGDVRNQASIERVFSSFKPEVVFHAAALKHVPLVEENTTEGVMTNVMGTANVANACCQNGAAAMVMISTDKAVNPTSIMGATKRIAESYCQAMDLRECVKKDGTRFITVRFGNVLGSTGSVVPLFQRQLAAGGPLTVTHPEVQRYFMTVREAVELVVQASAMGSRSRDQQGKIFVLDMGEPVRIMDLARQMIRLSGRQLDHDIKIEIIGMRPGEKLFEEMFHGGEPLMPTECKGILLAAPRASDREKLEHAIERLGHACDTNHWDKALQLITKMVPEYSPPDEEFPVPPEKGK